MKHERPKVFAKYNAQPKGKLSPEVEACIARGILPTMNHSPDITEYMATKPSPAGLQAFIDKLQATSSKDRRSPKLALAKVLLDTQHEFGPGYPRWADGAIPVSEK